MLYDSAIVLGVLIIASAIALPFGNLEKVAFRDFWFTAWLILVVFGYFAICWRRGITIGMRAWKVQIIDISNRPISWWQCLIRFVVALLSLGLLALGFFWALWDKQNRSWHDIAAGTLLIRSKKKPADSGG